MVHIQPVKSVWSTLHKVQLKTVGNKRRETEQSVLLCLEVAEEENGAAKRTQEAFWLNFPKQFTARSTRSPPPPLQTVLGSSAILILSWSYQFL